MDLENLTSVINDSLNALDRKRAFTFIEFVKISGVDNNDESFVSLYKEYLTRWAQKQEFGEKEQKQFVKERLVEILKTVTLTYSSYEEKQFIASLDWNNIEEVKTVVPLYAKRIKEICDFYRHKRNEAFFIVEKNKQKGSTVSLEQIIFDTIVDFVFNHQNVLPQVSDIKRNLSISIENYIDTYADYFDITRDKSLREKNENREPIGANMNNVDYRDYIEINTVIAEIIYSGEVYLEEIPLIANLSIDFSQECVGQLLEVKNKLLAEATINLVPLSEKISLRRRLYEKYVGCDLYYMYVDGNKNVKMDLLVKAKNPSGNLLNCGSPDTVTTPSNQLELLSHIGLFFKPDKTSILKVNAKKYTWEVDGSKLLEDTVYVFPDPDKYGDIGNNKDENYPLIMEYKLDYDIRNLSSGLSCDDPLVFIDSQVFSSYYSRQQDIFKTVENKNFEYSFTSLENFGIIHNYQTDAFGNEFAIFKRYKEVYIEDEEGNKHLDHVEVPDNVFPETKSPNVEEEKKQYKNILINGGYFEDPFHPGRPFDFTRKLTINDNYRWTSIILGKAPIVTPGILYDSIDFGEFGCTRGVKYIDHFGYTEKKTDFLEDKYNIITDVVEDFYSKLFDGTTTEQGVPVVKVKKNFVDLETEEGTAFVKIHNSIESKPQNLMSVFDWLPEGVKSEKVVSLSVMGSTLVLETTSKIAFVNYEFDGQKITNRTTNNKTLVLSKGELYSNVIYVEKDKSFYVVTFKEVESDMGYLLPTVYQFIPSSYKLQESYNVFDFVKELSEDFLKARHKYTFDADFVEAKEKIINDFIQSDSKKNILNNYIKQSDLNIDNFAFYYEGYNKPTNIRFSYNSALNTFLLVYILNSNNGFPYIYQHQFKLMDNETFKNTVKSKVFLAREKSDKEFVLWSDKAVGGKSVPENTVFFVEI